jgi:hypothetical protein
MRVCVGTAEDVDHVLAEKLSLFRCYSFWASLGLLVMECSLKCANQDPSCNTVERVRKLQSSLLRRLRSAFFIWELSRHFGTFRSLFDDLFAAKVFGLRQRSESMPEHPIAVV